MGQIFARGALIGVPVTFVVAFAIAMFAHVAAQGSFLIAGWGALVMGPFVGAMLFLAGRVGALSQ